MNGWKSSRSNDCAVSVVHMPNRHNHSLTMRVFLPKQSCVSILPRKTADFKKSCEQIHSEPCEIDRWDKNIATPSLPPPTCGAIAVIEAREQGVALLYKLMRNRLARSVTSAEKLTIRFRVHSFIAGEKRKIAHRHL